MSNVQTQIPITAFSDFDCNNKIAFDEGSYFERCNGREFTQVFQIKTYKGFQSNNELVIAQIPVFQCVGCGAIHKLNDK
jgi:hypothetical protein